MINSQKEFFFRFGWDHFFQDQLTQEDLNLYPAKVIGEERGVYRIQCGLDLERLAVVRGRLQFEAHSREEFPAVGDWVLISPDLTPDKLLISKLLRRKTIIYRRKVGGGSEMQILSANVDNFFITTSVNEDLNIRRIERYVALAIESNSKPILLLTKSDLYKEDLMVLISKLKSGFAGVDVFVLNHNEFEKAQFLVDLLKPGSASVFVGSSGVGKSTLVNYLIEPESGGNKIKTQEVRRGDSKGRHTTTSRSLYLSRFGGMIIDTPGMRELQLLDHAEGVSNQFSDIENLIESCRFSDCAHRTEPGCKILECLESGELSENRWLSFLKLKSEVNYAMRRQNKALASEQRKEWKRISIQGRERGRNKRKLI